MGESGKECAIAQDARPPVLIIGSGCTGLSVANGLRKVVYFHNIGTPAIIFEKEGAIESPGDRDWNMGLHWGMPVLKSMIPTTAASQLQSVQVDPNTPTKPLDTLAFLNGRTGEVMSAPEIADFYRLRRSKLRKLLVKDLDIRWNKRLRDIVYENDGTTVTAIFEDGQQISGRCIVGADGARSAVRRIMLGPDVAASTRLPYSATFVHSKYTREQALFLRSFHPLYIASPHPDGLFAFFGLQDAPDAEKPESWTFFFYISWNSSFEQQDQENMTFGNAERLHQVKELAKGYTEPWKSAFEWVADDQPAWHFDLNIWDPSLPEHHWDTKNGRVTLAGDAAHPMTYQRGQGLNHAITDAGKILEAFTSEATLDIAISAYEAEMRKRAGQEVRLSAMNTAMLHDWEKVLASPVMTAGLKQDAT